MWPFTKSKKIIIYILDTSSGAIVYWDHTKGHCAVRQVPCPESIKDREVSKAKAFYGPTGQVYIENR